MHTHNSSFPYNQADYEEVPCDLCSGVDTEVLGFSKEDPARAVICRKCGLIFISPRMTKGWYDRFYQEEYRAHGNDVNDLGARFEKQQRHGRALAEELEPYFFKKGLLVDVGASTGGTLAGLKETFSDFSVLGIEPSEKETAYAKVHGISMHATLIEDIEKKGITIPLADMVLSTQSLNHFLSPRYFLTWAWQHLKPSGRLILEVKNFRQQARRSSRVENSVQIDHVYMFTPETVREYMAAAGFRVLVFLDDEHLSIPAIRQKQQKGLPGFQIRVVAEKTDQLPFSNIAGAIDPASYEKIKSSLAAWRLRSLYFLKYGGARDFLRNRLKKFF
ncbi:MAG: class I SAM-dependent methyltransferase [bacterium]|nr:class I SAM-dependent methyltransferase [bacterium]